jgi:hypothetical protein
MSQLTLLEGWKTTQTWQECDILTVYIYSVLLLKHMADCLQLSFSPTQSHKARADQGGVIADQKYGGPIHYSTSLSKTACQRVLQLTLPTGHAW